MGDRKAPTFLPPGIHKPAAPPAPPPVATDIPFVQAGGGFGSFRVHCNLSPDVIKAIQLAYAVGFDQGQQSGRRMRK